MNQNPLQSEKSERRTLERVYFERVYQEVLGRCSCKHMEVRLVFSYDPHALRARGKGFDRAVTTGIPARDRTLLSGDLLQ